MSHLLCSCLNLNARRRLAALLLALGAHGATWAQSSLMIWPLDPVIEADQRASALWLENRGSQPLTLQVRVLTWHQREGRDSYEEQDLVVASPPVAQIPPGQRQLVRLMNTQAAPAGSQQAYRVLVDELPQLEVGDGASAQAGSAMGIKLQIRYSVPLFVSGTGHWTKVRADRSRDADSAARPELRWHTEREQDTHFLVVRNSGNAHARLTAAQWLDGDVATSFSPGLLGYVLPGAQMRWKLQAAPPAASVLQARVNGSAEPLRLSPQ